jgi:hypothetical protein
VQYSMVLLHISQLPLHLTCDLVTSTGR